MTKKSNLYREHNRLIEVMFVRGLTKCERRRLESVREKLDGFDSTCFIERIMQKVEEAQRNTESTPGVSFLVGFHLAIIRSMLGLVRSMPGCKEN